MEHCDPDKPRRLSGLKIPDIAGQEQPHAVDPEKIPGNSDPSMVNPGGVNIDPDPETQARDFVTRLTDEERMLILLKKELYEGSWQAMLSDLNNRLKGKPYIFKLANRIHDDIDRIEKLKAFETQYHVDLADFVLPPKP